MTPRTYIRATHQDCTGLHHPTLSELEREVRKARVRGDSRRAGALRLFVMARLRRAQREAREELS